MIPYPCQESTLTHRHMRRLERARKRELLRGTLSGPHVRSIRRPGFLRWLMRGIADAIKLLIRLVRGIADAIKLLIDIRGRNGLT